MGCVCVSDHATVSTKAPVVSGGSVRPVVCDGAEWECVLVLWVAWFWVCM